VYCALLAGLDGKLWRVYFVVKLAVMAPSAVESMYVHGCTKCYKPEDIRDTTMNILYEKTIKNESVLKQMGFKVKSIWGCEFITPREVQVNDIIKCNNKYSMISNGLFAFKDIMAYLSPNTSLETVLKAFDTESQK
jgi:hypothetical protein